MTHIELDHLNPMHQTKMWFPLLLLVFFFTTFTVLVDSMATNLTMSNEEDFPLEVTIAKTITVSQTGQADFKKIQDAIDSVPSDNKQWIHIRIYSGVYTEKVNIPREKPYIFLEGDGRHKTMIKWSDHGELDLSATFTSSADNFVAKGISFQNNYNVKYDVDQRMEQAAAARIYGDKSAFYGCSFVGLQDTLWDVQGRHYYSNCHIIGGVDFICGNAQSFFENCQIQVIVVSGGYITAQKRESQNDPGGFVFYKGRVFGNVPVYLGRPWGYYSRVIFLKTTFDIDVVPEGWNTWNKPTDNLFYVEQDCSGKGSDVSKRVEWSQHNLPANEMQPYTRANFIQDVWLTEQPN